MSNPLDLPRRPHLEGNGAEQTERLSAIQQRLDDTDEEIAGTLAHLRRLKARRRDILVELNAVTSPILNLPLELVCEIFLECLPPPRTVPSPRDAPLLLGQVCRQWRNIALSLPALWSTICVASLLSVDARDGPRSALLDLWLERSENCTLSVLWVPLNNLTSWDLFGGRAHSAVFKKIRHMSHRWRELEIVRQLEDFPVLLPRDMPWLLPELVKLSLLLSHGSRPTAFAPDLLSNFMDAPALREVHLMGFTPLLPWSQLTTVHAENFFPMECLQTLTQSTSLVDGTFSLWSNTQSFHLPNHAPLVRLPRLKSLTLTGELCTGILDHLEFPALEHFATSFGPHNDFTPLTAFLARLPALKSVDLEVRAAVLTGDLIGCLEALDHVETLALGFHSGLMNGMLPHVLQTNPTVLPCVRRLEVRERIDRYNEAPLDSAVVVDMLRARRAHGLAAFCLVTTHVFHTVDPAFHALACEGMDIELRSHGSGPFLVVYFTSALARRMSSSSQLRALA